MGPPGGGLRLAQAMKLAAGRAPVARPEQGPWSGRLRGVGA
jgi:hypothetical protein